MAPVSLVSILPVNSGVNTHEWNGCHTPLLSDYSSTSKCLLAHKCNVALERYHTCRPSLLCYTAAQNVQAVLKYLKSIGLSSTYFSFTQVSHLQVCNAAGINYIFLFRKPSSTAAKFSAEEMVFLPAVLAKQAREGKLLKEFNFFLLFYTIQKSVLNRRSSSMRPWLSHSDFGMLPSITTNDILKAADYSLGSVFRKIYYRSFNDPSFGRSWSVLTSGNPWTSCTCSISLK